MTTKKLIKQAIATLDDKIAALEGNKHPQIVVTVVAMKAERDAFAAVLDSMNGSNALIKLYL